MSGYVPCACRDCFEIAVGEPGALCDDCQAAGCEACDCKDPDRGCPHGECQSPDAYGRCEECGSAVEHDSECSLFNADD